MELISSSLGIHPTALAAAVEADWTLRTVERIALGQLTAPLNEPWARRNSTAIRQLERDLIDWKGSHRIVSIPKVLARQDDLRDLDMTQLMRADFEDAVLTVTDPQREMSLLKECRQESKLLRDRYRRVRNAVNHGLPLHDLTLDSVRQYGGDTATTAMNWALTWFKSQKPGEEIISAAQAELDRVETASHRGDNLANRQG